MHEGSGFGIFSALCLLWFLFFVVSGLQGKTRDQAIADCQQAKSSVEWARHHILHGGESEEEMRTSLRDCENEGDNAPKIQFAAGLLAVPAWLCGGLIFLLHKEEEQRIFQGIGEKVQEGIVIVNNTFSNIKNSVINNWSDRASGSVQVDDQSSLPEGWDHLSRLVEKSENQRAKEHYDELKAELEKENPDGFRARGLWEGLVQALPAAKDLLELAANLSKLWA